MTNAIRRVSQLEHRSPGLAFRTARSATAGLCQSDTTSRTHAAAVAHAGVVPLTREHIAQVASFANSSREQSGANPGPLEKRVAALGIGGRMVLHGFVMDDDRVGSAFGALFALDMLVGTDGGNTYTESEIRCGCRRPEATSAVAYFVRAPACRQRPHSGGLRTVAGRFRV
jgi:hypothetical protein